MRSVTTHAAFLAALLLLPLAAEAAPERLTVPGFRDAAFVAPAGPGKRPVALALHGNFDRPEWICEEFSVLVEGRGWLLCPRGIPRRDAPEEWDRWTYAGRKRLLAEIAAGLAALAGRFPGRVDEGPLVLTGFSLGAILGAELAVEDAKRFPRAVLVEGGAAAWTPAKLKRFAVGGGVGILFGCGGKGCGLRAERLCRSVRKAGPSCGAVTVPGLGHSYSDPWPRRALPLFRSLVAGDPRWVAAP